MIFIRDTKELQRKRSQVPNEIIPYIENDLKIIQEEYPKYDKDFVNSYGPLVVLIDRSERSDLKRKMPVIKQLVSEYEEIVLKTKDTRIKKKLYILTESGILVYERYQKWGSD